MIGMDNKILFETIILYVVLCVKLGQLVLKIKTRVFNSLHNSGL